MKRIGMALLLAGLLGLTASGDIEQLGDGLFVAGVKSAEFEYFAAPEQEGLQRQVNWCWAACIQMVLNYHGLRVSQEEVVLRVYGQLADRPAQSHQILGALSGWAPDARGRFSSIHASPYVLQGSDLVRDLAFRWPLIVGLRTGAQVDHALVLTAVTYSVDRNNQPIFRSVVLRDPMPGRPSRVELPWAEFQQRLMFICRVYVQRL